MPRRPRTAHDRPKGRHKKNGSKETQTWNAEHAPPPGRPAWMTEDVYQQLSALRAELEGPA